MIYLILYVVMFFVALYLIARTDPEELGSSVVLACFWPFLLLFLVIVAPVEKIYNLGVKHHKAKK